MSTPSNHAKSLRRAAISLMAVTVLGLLSACGGAPAREPGAAQGSSIPSDKTGKAAAAPVQEESPERIFCYVETLTSDRPSGYGYVAPQGCVPSGEFKRGERMVWRFIAMDLRTGKRITPTEATSAALKVPFLPPIRAEFKQRGEGRVPDAPWTWDVCWDIPLDYPLGILDYSIMVTTNDGQASSWKPPALVDPSRGIDSRPRVVGEIPRS